MTEKFPPEVREKLRCYVYRLIDPRNGETFYVGKGKDDRVFEHVQAKLPNREETILDLKLKRIEDIRSTGLEVVHIIHRHGMSDAEAFLVEAAIIDAYPGLTNRVGGHGTSDFGTAHASELIGVYSAEEFIQQHPLLLISVARTYNDSQRSLYDATRYAWKINPEKVTSETVVLPHVGGLVKGAFANTSWKPATKGNFPLLEEDVPDRWGFDGIEAPHQVRKLYVGKRIPSEHRKQGAANPIRYIPLRPPDA